MNRSFQKIGNKWFLVDSDTSDPTGSFWPISEKADLEKAYKAIQPALRLTETGSGQVLRMATDRKGGRNARNRSKVQVVLLTSTEQLTPTNIVRLVHPAIFSPDETAAYEALLAQDVAAGEAQAKLEAEKARQLSDDARKAPEGDPSKGEQDPEGRDGVSAPETVVEGEQA